ncbi:hypothetical protein UK12_34190, partial [Saccharothrix sp. ST-888]
MGQKVRRKTCGRVDGLAGEGAVLGLAAQHGGAAPTAEQASEGALRARVGGDVMLRTVAERVHRGFTGGSGEVGYMPLPCAPVVHKVDRKNSGGFQELAGEEAVLALAAEH